MPTYEYACKSCGKDLEVVQSFTDEPLRICPSCGGELKKVFGNVGIVFKGSGFYKTDSRSATSSTVTSTSDSKSSTESSATKTETSSPGSTSSDAASSSTSSPSTPASTS